MKSVTIIEKSSGKQLEAVYANHKGRMKYHVEGKPLSDKEFDKLYYVPAPELDWKRSISKPDLDHADRFNAQQGLSVRVVVWIKGHDIANFGRYHHTIGTWLVEGCAGFDQEDVKYWKYIHNPY